MGALVLSGAGVIFLVASLMTVSASSLPSSLHQCVINEKITQFPHNGSACCQNEAPWLVKVDPAEDEEGGQSYKCVPDVFCTSNNETGAWYRNKCRPLFEDGVCGDEVLGERLYVGPNGNGTCDCEEGWIRHEGRCYQEFSPAFCGAGEVLNLGTKEPLEAGQNYSCITNPCNNVKNALPNRITWKDRFCHPRPEVDDIAVCELYVSNKDVDKSVLKCCEPWGRRECTEEVLLTPAAATPHCKNKGCCKRGNVFSFPLKKCVAGFKA